jgi:alpha-beta hydrolase superfamily lysophospholipase
MFRAFLFSLTLATGTASAVASVETHLLTLTGHASMVDVYAPAAPPRALAVIAHGFTRSRAQHVVLAEQLAEAGFLVAVPDLPHSVRHEANADAIVALVAAIVAERKLDTLPVVLIGTSAGGLAALLATDRVPRLALWIGLDPVDAFGQSRGVARSLRVPAVVLRAPNGACNVAGSARRIATWLPSRRMERRIASASHCDFEDTTDWRCESICGPADAARQSLIVTETVKVAREAVPD